MHAKYWRLIVQAAPFSFPFHFLSFLCFSIPFSAPFIALSLSPSQRRCFLGFSSFLSSFDHIGSIHLNALPSKFIQEEAALLASGPFKSVFTRIPIVWSGFYTTADDHNLSSFSNLFCSLGNPLQLGSKHENRTRNHEHVPGSLNILIWPLENTSNGKPKLSIRVEAAISLSLSLH